LTSLKGIVCNGCVEGLLANDVILSQELGYVVMFGNKCLWLRWRERSGLLVSVSFRRVDCLQRYRGTCHLLLRAHCCV